VLLKLEKFSDVTILFLDFADYTWEEQIRIVRHTDLLVGVHGAGLTQLIYLNDNSTVLEIVPQGYYPRKHFQALSTWLGHKYISSPAGLINPDETVTIDEKFYHLFTTALTHAREMKCRQNPELFCVRRNEPADIIHSLDFE
jgi:capsular polysaccharide biosynthesis protein